MSCDACRVCRGTRLHRGLRCEFCDQTGRPLHRCSRCREALPLCPCFGMYRQEVRTS